MEIIAHEALEKPLLDTLVPVPPESRDPEGRSGRPFTMIRHAAGRGMSGSCFGNDVWPETNVQIVLYLNEEDIADIRRSVQAVRARYPKLGLAVFVAEDYHEWYDGPGSHD
jgi:hypothetical protein